MNHSHKVPQDIVILPLHTSLGNRPATIHRTRGDWRSTEEHV